MSIISSRLEFESCLNKFCNEINSCSKGAAKWEIETTQTILKQSFSRRRICLPVPQRPANVDIDNISIMGAVEDDDEGCIAQESAEIVQLEHHVVYSSSYQVPVIYFTASFSDGSPLSYQEIFQYVVPNLYQDAVITQNDHPILGVPYWYVHPCDTRSLMETMAFDQPDYIKVWLSVYGPIVKCSVPTRMFQ
ncbi:autophagocytosis associated protein [Parasitella parasitica]|nr:autophagocytosis associated protein [Parasitella parasitica]